jgi:hypothetical protein
MAQSFTSTKASGVWTISAGHLANAEYMTIDGKRYTFLNTLLGADGDVYLPTGSNDAADVAALISLVKAINLDGTGTAGTNYGQLTTRHPTVSAVVTSARVMTVTAKIPGSNGNTIAFSDNTAQASVDHAHLQGGGDITILGGVQAVGTLTRAATTDLLADGDTITFGSTTYRFKTTPAQAQDILLSASSDAGTIAALNSLAKVINGTGTLGAVGTEDGFTASTSPHPTVKAGTCTSLTQVFTARLPGVHGNVLPFSEVIVDAQITMDGSGVLGGTTAGSGSTATDLTALGNHILTLQPNGLISSQIAAMIAALSA